MIKKRLHFIFILGLIQLFVVAQKPDSIKLTKIQVLARVTSQKVTFRWAPDNANAWLLGNKFGYVIERYTFLKNGKTTNIQAKTILTSIPIKPWPLEKWKAMADTSDFAAVAAQAIYGNDFEVDLNKKDDIASVFNKAKETESRFSFALHAVNQSELVAKASGLWFSDTTAQKNESYLYRIYLAVPKEMMRVDTGIIFVNAGKPDKLSRLREVSAVTSGNAIMISWSTLRYAQNYDSYRIERSEDGGRTFHALNSIPYVCLGSEESAMPGRAVYLDSVPQFNVPYFYRVKGLTSFAETGPPSDSVMVIAQKGLYNPPTVKSTEVVNGKVVLRWEVVDTMKDAIKGFNVERASSLQGIYSQINKVLLPAESRIFADSIPASSNYYRIMAIDKKGNPHTSVPYFVQPEDSIPPAPPVGLIGTIDTTGIVHLVWKNNDEPDLLGYRIYRSYFTSAEFVQVTPEPIKQNHHTEKVRLKNLNKFLYYKITALDRHYNQSAFSKIIQVKQPDIVPPSSPAIRAISATDKGISITVSPSSSDDVEKYVIYRKENNDSLWSLEKVILSGSVLINYTDSTSAYGNTYVYNVLAVDSSGNESVPTRTVKCKALNDNNKNSTIIINVTKDLESKAIEITWVTSRDDISTILIYKATGEEPIAQYATCKAGNGSFSDNNVKLNSKYRYMIKAAYADGTESGFSKVEIVNY